MSAFWNSPASVRGIESVVIYVAAEVEDCNLNLWMLGLFLLEVGKEEVEEEEENKGDERAIIEWNIEEISIVCWLPTGPSYCIEKGKKRSAPFLDNFTSLRRSLAL